MKIFDRLYGEMVFPEIIKRLLDCPGLLRLKDVRMANNQFVAFPAFSNVSRYEHSLGVCYLAGICAKTLNLSEKDTIELMMAALYHDVGTPPFAHAMEEVLQFKYGFDHENNLRQIIEGRNDSYIGNLEQIYLGETVKLRSVCQSKEGRKLGLDVYRIAKIIVGDKTEPLSILLNGNGMDLDNIDNVIRASTAMGIIDSKDYELAKRLAASFIYNVEGNICHNALFLQDIRRWQQIRDEQYTAIFESIDDFAYQTMIKKALLLLINEQTSQCQLDKFSWKLTDAEILHEYLLKNEKSAPIMKRVLLNKPFHNLCVLYIAGDKVAAYINNNLSDIEKVASDFYKERMGTVEEVNDDGNCVVANFFLDKRKREIHMEAMMMGKSILIDEKKENFQGALLGLFISTTSNSYKTIINEAGVKIRKIVSFTAADIEELMEVLKDKIFKEFEVSIYGKTKDKRNSESFTQNQLEFF